MILRGTLLPIIHKIYNIRNTRDIRKPYNHAGLRAVIVITPPPARHHSFSILRISRVLRVWGDFMDFTDYGGAGLHDLVEFNPGSVRIKRVTTTNLHARFSGI